MRALGFDVKKADVLKILHNYDREGAGRISFEDFEDTRNAVTAFSRVCVFADRYAGGWTVVM